jgi:hypothetical protein
MRLTHKEANNEVLPRRFYKRREDVVFAINMVFVQSMELIPLLVAPLVLKFGIHLGQAGRKGVRGGRGKGMEKGQ